MTKRDKTVILPEEPKDGGYWISITEKLPIHNPPPLLSLHWSVAWPNMEYVKMQRQRHANVKIFLGVEYEDQEDLPYLSDGTIASSDGGRLREPDWLQARKIMWNGEEVRIFPHEFTKTSDKILAFDVLGECFELQAADVAHNKLVNLFLKDDLKPAYESLLLDGCNPDQALLVLHGYDIDKPEVEPSGWYKLKPEYQEYFR